MSDVLAVDVQLEAPQATITMQNHIALSELQSAVSKAGNYRITEVDSVMHMSSDKPEPSQSWFKTYKPILLIFIFISIVTIIAATAGGTFDWMKGMNVFMSGFFFTFSFFKLLDLEGFADNYSSYDIISKQFRSWGYIYPFVELGLGIAYAMEFNPIITNIITLTVMSISIIGVLQSVLNKRKIQCACLGTVFKLPMSTVTIIEDAVMIIMSVVMLITLL